MKFRIAIADDHRIFSEGIMRILNGNAEMVWIADSGAEMLQKLAQQQPDVLLLDVNLKDYNGLTLFEQFHKKYPELKVIALTMYDDHYVVNRAWELGFSGFLLKNTEPEELSSAIRDVLNNKRHFSAQVEHVIEAKQNMPFDLSGIRISERER
jgi:DNA-binding NarL/FixJ family response regulator